ncbi:rab GTPase-activating protein 22-like [Impatiens glandulifera]|uniref:rab GTPase-activating protein 22-like n=1 Tax=Impatiens glandulifera TaxID=253017 RepID=UPI001FB0A9FC|nr:rab GTPase-activating protein 22-like [Impatiens glandulifera]
MKALLRSQTSSTSSSNSSSPSSSSSSSSSWIHLRSVLLVVASSSTSSHSSSDRSHLKSPWSRRKRKNPLSPRQWRNLFTPDGKLRDGGSKLLRKVRSAGIDPSIRAEVWPFLLGVYDLNSSKVERDTLRSEKRKEYEKHRRQCRRFLKVSKQRSKLKETCGECNNNDGAVLCFHEGINSPDSEDAVSTRESLSSEEDDNPNDNLDSGSRRISYPNTPMVDSDSSVSEDSSDDIGLSNTFLFMENHEETEDPSTCTSGVDMQLTKMEDFSTWQRIIRLDAVRFSEDGITYSPGQASVSLERASRAAEAVGLKDYENLEACRIFHAARLTAILEAYAVYDPEVGYCQGMSDLLSPIIAVMSEDHEAFWCFVGFMRKARHNFRLDEVGIRRQLNIVSRIIKSKDSHLYRHLEKLEAEDCFFVYRMVVVLFRRELTFEQTVCLWEVMWADQAAIRAGIGKSAWSRIRQRAPPTEDLLLYAIAASVLQRRKQIIERYSSMDEIVKECNSMSGHLDVWKLLGDAHDLVVTLHDKIEEEDEDIEVVEEAVPP